MSATELMQEIQSLPEQERERIFEFVLHSQKPDWATPKPPGYFVGCYDKDEIEESNSIAARVRTEANRLSQSERESLFKKGMQIIYGGIVKK